MILPFPETFRHRVRLKWYSLSNEERCKSYFPFLIAKMAEKIYI